MKKVETELRRVKARLGEGQAVSLSEDKKLVERVDQFGKGLSKNEVDFLESCLERVGSGRELSEKQRKWLEDIDERKVP